MKDGLAETRLVVPKSIWALLIDRAPFLAGRVAPGIIFTFSGFAVMVTGRDSRDAERVFDNDYPVDSGLTPRAAFARHAR